MPSRSDRPPSLGELEQLVLLAVVRLDDDAYGVTIRQEIERRTGRRRTLGAIYKALERLEGKGLLASRLGEPTPVRGGRRRRYYTLEGAGAEALESSLDAIRAMTRGLRPRFRE